MAAAGALLGYVEETQKQRLPHLTAIAVESADEAIAMNAVTRRHLELDVRTDGRTQHTLLGVVDSTVSPMGGRMLRRWLHRPLRDQRVLGERHHAVQTLLETGADASLRETFRRIGDLERILTRIALRSARPRDLSTLRDGLATLPELRQVLDALDSPRLAALAAELGVHGESAALLAEAIVEHPPVLQRDGGVIADGFDAELDELRRLSTHADQFLVDLETRERAASGISTLKVGYNRVHGYYIEISKGQAERAPTHYTRRQTLTGAERYITEELKAFEDKVLSARERSLTRERALYEFVLDALNEELEPLKRCAAALSELDVLAAFSERAQALDWSRPQLSDTPGLRIERGRHPVVEAARNEPFEPNDLCLDESRRMLVITGPNMGGKSTYMRQNALIVLLAHIGSFVPAALRADRSDRPHPDPHRRRRRPGARAVHLHGRNVGDQLHPSPRHRAFAGAHGRNRPRHLDLRRTGARRSLRTTPGATQPRLHPVRDALLRTDRAGRTGQRHRQRAPGRDRTRRQAGLHARGEGRPGQPQLRPCRWRRWPACRAASSTRRAGRSTNSSNAASCTPPNWRQPRSTSHANSVCLRSPRPSPEAMAQIDPDELTPKQALEALYRLRALM